MSTAQHALTITLQHHIWTMLAQHLPLDATREADVAVDALEQRLLRVLYQVQLSYLSYRFLSYRFHSYRFSLSFPLISHLSRYLTLCHHLTSIFNICNYLYYPS